ncbi:MAG: MlaD family protein [Bacteroidota bacterium]|nr:MlaD family protein [Bacteroidota bacterium]
MNASGNKRSVLVGIFVLLGIIIFVAGIFILGGQQRRFQSTLNVIAVFDDVAGLRKGNNVWFSGVKVGTVRGITFHGLSQVQITMRIEEGVQRFIRKDSKVRISSEGLIGNRILVIEGGSPDAPYVEDGDLLATEASLDTEDMMATLQENNENLVSITRDFKELSAKILQGEGTVGALLTDPKVASNFKDVITNMEQVSQNSVKATGALSRFSSKLNNADGLANQLFTDTVVFQQLKASVQQLHQTTATAQEITGNLNQASSKLTTSDNSMGMLLNDQQFANSLRNTMQNLESGTDKLDQNMEALQHNFLFRGFFRRQAREAAKRQQD